MPLGLGSGTARPLCSTPTNKSRRRFPSSTTSGAGRLLLGENRRVVGGPDRLQLLLAPTHASARHRVSASPDVPRAEPLPGRLRPTLVVELKRAGLPLADPLAGRPARPR